MDPRGAVKGYCDRAARRAARPPRSAGGSGSISPRSRRLTQRCTCSAYAADVERVRLDLEAYRRALADAALSAVVCGRSPPDCETRREPRREARARARARADAGGDFYHYGFLRLEALDLVRAARSRRDVQVRPADPRRRGRRPGRRPRGPARRRDRRRPDRSRRPRHPGRGRVPGDRRRPARSSRPGSSTCTRTSSTR